MSDHHFTMHMNGTSAAEFLETSTDVCNLVSQLREALNRCAPNMRDYYTVENGTELHKQDRAKFVELHHSLRLVDDWATARGLHATQD